MLRERGLSLREIAAAVGASLGSVSIWTRDIAPASVVLERIGAQPLVGRPLPLASLSAVRRCGRCGITLPLCAFGRGQCRCRRCFRAVLPQNGAIFIASSPRAALERRRGRAKQHLLHYLQDHACADCGETDPVVLEFDHVRGKHGSCRQARPGWSQAGAPRRGDRAVRGGVRLLSPPADRRRAESRAGPSRPGRLRKLDTFVRSSTTRGAWTAERRIRPSWTSTTSGTKTDRHHQPRDA